MLEKPDILDDLILAQVQEKYGLGVESLTFLPLGADINTAVYRIATDDKSAYFLKLRKNFNFMSVAIPLFLRGHGVKEIIAPLKSSSSRPWLDFGDYAMILYPFVDGKNGFEAQLSDQHKRTLGSALKKIHSAQIPAELKSSISKEVFSPYYRDSMKAFLVELEGRVFHEPIAAKLAEFMKLKRDEIRHLVVRSEALAFELKSTHLEFVLCHTDIHGGNILMSDTNKLYIVDWDGPQFAPKERDLMFIGGGIDEIWKDKRDEDLFYEGYGDVNMNLVALAYYRYERIIVDLVEFCQQLLLTNVGGADREQAYRWFVFNFEPGKTIDIAKKTDESKS